MNTWFGWKFAATLFLLSVAGCQTGFGSGSGDNCYVPIPVITNPTKTVSQCQAAAKNMDATLKQNLEAQYNLGRALVLDGQFGAAIAPLNAVLKSDPSRTTARLDLAMALSKIQRYNEALNLLDGGQIDRRNNAYLDLLFVRADAYVGRGASGDSDKAMRDLMAARERAAVLSGVDANSSKAATQRLKQVALGIGQREKSSSRLDALQRARDAFEVALGADPASNEALMGVGETTLKMANYYGADAEHDNLLRAAYNAFQRAAQQKSTLETNKKAVGALNALHKKSRSDWARLISHHSRIVSLEPGDTSAQLALAGAEADYGRFLRAGGDFQESSRQLQSAAGTYETLLRQSNSGSNGQAHLELAKIYQLLGRTSDAQAHFNQAGGQPLALLETGKIQYARRDYPAATKSFNEVIKLTNASPRSALRAEALYYFSRTASESPFGVNRREVAIRSADDALTFDPGNAAYRQQACLARIKWGDVMSREAESLCRVGVRDTSTELKAIEGMFHLRKAFLQSGGDQKRSWESAYSAFTDGLAISGLRSTQSGESASWYNRLKVGQALAHYCVGFANIGREVTRQSDAGTRDAEDYFKTFGVATCPSGQSTGTR